MTELSLTITRTISAPIADVFKAWLSPAKLAKFMIPGEGMSVPSAKVDAREGGRFSIIMRAGENDLPHGGTYKVIRPHSQIVFTWESPMAVDGSVVMLNFRENQSGTEVELIHKVFVDEESRDDHKGGWTNILNMLDNTLT